MTATVHDRALLCFFSVVSDPWSPLCSAWACQVEHRAQPFHFVFVRFFRQHFEKRGGAVVPLIKFADVQHLWEFPEYADDVYQCLLPLEAVHRRYIAMPDPDTDWQHVSVRTDARTIAFPEWSLGQS